MPVRYALDVRLNNASATPRARLHLQGRHRGVRTAGTGEKETDTIDGNHGVYECTTKDPRRKTFGRLSFSDALTYSSNVCFAKVANDIWERPPLQIRTQLRVRRAGGIQLPGEESGVVHPIDKWSGRTRVTNGDWPGSERDTAAHVAPFRGHRHGGVLAEPRMLETVARPMDPLPTAPGYTPVRRVIDQNVAARLTTMLCGVVTKDTGVKAAIPGIAVAGKTGTAQKIDKETGAYSNIRAGPRLSGLPGRAPAASLRRTHRRADARRNGWLRRCSAYQKIMSQIISHPQLRVRGKNTGSPRQTAVTG